MFKTVPTYLVAGPSVVLCTVCGQRTLRPTKAMMDRNGIIITDGCGECQRWHDQAPQPTPATYPGYPRHLPRIPSDIAHLAAPPGGD